jgi:hypothetical protein
MEIMPKMAPRHVFHLQDASFASLRNFKINFLAWKSLLQWEKARRNEKWTHEEQLMSFDEGASVIWVRGKGKETGYSGGRADKKAAGVARILKQKQQTSTQIKFKSSMGRREEKSLKGYQRCARLSNEVRCVTLDRKLLGVQEGFAENYKFWMEI